MRLEFPIARERHPMRVHPTGRALCRDGPVDDFFRDVHVHGVLLIKMERGHLGRDNACNQ